MIPLINKRETGVNLRRILKFTLRFWRLILQLMPVAGSHTSELLDTIWYILGIKIRRNPYSWFFLIWDK